MEGLNKTIRNLGQDRRKPGRDLNWALSNTSLQSCYDISLLEVNTFWKEPVGGLSNGAGNKQ